MRACAPAVRRVRRRRRRSVVASVAQRACPSTVLKSSIFFFYFFRRFRLVDYGRRHSDRATAENKKGTTNIFAVRSRRHHEDFAIRFSPAHG